MTALRCEKNGSNLMKPLLCLLILQSFVSKRQFAGHYFSLLLVQIKKSKVSHECPFYAVALAVTYTAGSELSKPFIANN